MRLVDDWKSAWKWATVQISTGAALLFAVGPDLLAAWGLMPSDLKAALPDWSPRWIAAVTFLLVVLGRIFTITPKPAEQKGE